MFPCYFSFVIFVMCLRKEEHIETYRNISYQTNEGNRHVCPVAGPTADFWGKPHRSIILSLLQSSMLLPRFMSEWREYCVVTETELAATCNLQHAFWNCVHWLFLLEAVPCYRHRDSLVVPNVGDSRAVDVAPERCQTFQTSIPAGVFVFL